MLHQYMSDRERQDLVGKKVFFTVIRDRSPVERRGIISRVTPIVVWVGCYCYHVDEMQGLREVREAH